MRASTNVAVFAIDQEEYWSEKFIKSKGKYYSDKLDNWKKISVNSLQLMTIYSTAQPIETHRKTHIDGILHCRPSYTHAAQHFLVSATILFLTDQGKRVD